VGYHVADASKIEWEERPPAVQGEKPRLAADVTTVAELKQSRGRVWRYPPHTRGRRHADKAQEEVFVVISATLTMLLGEPPERVDVGPQSVVAVQPGTPLQVRNETDDELVLYIYGAPPEQEGADFFDDVEVPPRPRRRGAGMAAVAARGGGGARAARGLFGGAPPAWRGSRACTRARRAQATLARPRNPQESVRFLSSSSPRRSSAISSSLASMFWKHPAHPGKDFDNVVER
jgi:mannose-6-phosphate isomerase-like protein (cupin superfamily)